MNDVEFVGEMINWQLERLGISRSLLRANAVDDYVWILSDKDIILGDTDVVLKSNGEGDGHEGQSLAKWLHMRTPTPDTLRNILYELNYIKNIHKQGKTYDWSRD